jgi:hypothetical protein
MAGGECLNIFISVNDPCSSFLKIVLSKLIHTFSPFEFYSRSIYRYKLRIPALTSVIAS